MEEIEKKGLEKLMNKAFEFIDVIIKPPLQEVGGLLADQVKFWRYKNQVDILIKAKEYHDKKGIAPKKIPVKTLVNLIEAGSYEEDESLQNKWAAMLANATDASNNFELHNMFIDILKQLSSLEVKVLDFMYKEAERNNERAYYSKYILTHMRVINDERGVEKYKFTELDKENEKIIVDNLARVNLVEYFKNPVTNPNVIDGGDSGFSIQRIELHNGEINDIRLTNLGLKFVKESNFKS